VLPYPVSIAVDGLARHLLHRHRTSASPRLLLRQSSLLPVFRLHPPSSASISPLRAGRDPWNTSG
jgi:hypothetical protein